MNTFNLARATLQRCVLAPKFIGVLFYIHDLDEIRHQGHLAQQIFKPLYSFHRVMR